MFQNKLVKNLFSLSLAEIATKGIVFFLNVYIARVLKVEGYGIITNITSIVVYLTMINLGFNMVGLRAVSKNPADKEKFVNNILTLKLFLSIIIFAGLTAYILLLSEQSYIEKIALLLGSLQLFSTSLQIDWFYQSIERMEILGIRQFLVSLVTFIGVILFVKSPADIPIYMAIVSISLLLNNGWLLILYIKKYAKIHLEFQLKFWKKLLNGSLPITASTICTTIINSFNIIYLGMTVSDYKLGLFGAAFKLYAFSIIPASIIQNAFIPSIARTVDVQEKQQAMQKYSKMLAFVASIIPIIMIFFSEFFITVVYGDRFIDAVINLRYLMFAIFFGFYNVSIMPAMLAWGKEKIIMGIFAAAAIVNIILNIILVNSFAEVGSAFASIGSELTASVLLTILLMKEINKNYIFIFLKFIGIAIIPTAISYFIFNSSLITNNSVIHSINNFVNDYINVPNFSQNLLGILTSFAGFLLFLSLFGIIKIKDLKRSLKNEI